MTRTDLARTLPSMLPRLWTFALHVTGDPDSAERLVHQASIQALEHAHQAENDMSSRHWVFSVITELWICEERLRPAVDAGEHRSSSITSLGARSGGPILMEERIVDVVQELPDSQRLVMLLVAVEGLTLAQTSAVLQLPIEIVLHRLSIAHKAIGSALRSEHGNVFEPVSVDHRYPHDVCV